MSSPPGRRTKGAESTRRNSWYGLGTYTTAEKDGFGRFLDDVVYLFADVTLFALPTLAVVASTPDRAPLGVSSATLVAWLSLVLVGTLLRGGWLRPLGTAVYGWIAWSPSMVLLRTGYYNAAVVTGAFGGVAIAGATGSAVGGAGWSLVTGVVGALAFPRVAEVVAAAVAKRWPTGVPGRYRP